MLTDFDINVVYLQFNCTKEEFSQFTHFGFSMCCNFLYSIFIHMYNSTCT